MNSEDVTIISIVGKKNAGKTTLITDLIPKLKEHGYTVGTLKYNIKKFDVDYEGKDTYKYFHSGADSIALTTNNTLAVVKKISKPLKLKEIIKTHLNDISLILVEGYRNHDYPRIRIVDKRETIINNESENELVMVQENMETRHFSINNINKALEFIEKMLKTE